LRSDDRDHTLVYAAGNPGDHVVAFELACERELDTAGAELDNAGHRVRAERAPSASSVTSIHS